MTVVCPFCEKVDDFYEFSCPHAIGVSIDADSGTQWKGKFQILDDIDLKMKNLDEVADWQEAFESLGFWANFDCSEDYLTTALAELSHPDILSDSYCNEESHAPGWGNVFFVSEDKQAKVLHELKEVNKRLDELGFWIDTDDLQNQIDQAHETQQNTSEEKIRSAQIKRSQNLIKRSRDENFPLMLLKLQQWKNDLLEIQFNNGDTYRVSINAKKLGIYEGDGAHEKWIDGLKVEQVVIANPEKRQLIESLPYLTFDPNNARKIINLTTGETITNQD